MTTNVRSSYCSASWIQAFISAEMRARISSAGRCATSAQQRLQPLLAELDVVRIVRFGDAIRVREQHVAGAQVNGGLLVAHARQHADDGASDRELLHRRSRCSGVVRVLARARTRYGGLCPALT